MRKDTPKIDPGRLRRARKTAGFSQEGLAAEIGISKSQVSNIERGESGIAALTFVAWATACGVKDLTELTSTA